VAIEPFRIVDAIQINPILFKHEHNSSCPVYKTQETTSAQLEPDQAEAFSWISEEFQNCFKSFETIFFRTNLGGGKYAPILTRQAPNPPKIHQIEPTRD